MAPYLTCYFVVILLYLHISLDNILLPLSNKKILTEIHRNISASRMQFLGVKKLCSANMFFLTPNRNMLAGKF